MSNDLPCAIESATASIHAAKTKRHMGSVPKAELGFLDLQCLLDELERQAKEIEALKADAARYRWLQGNKTHSLNEMASMYLHAGTTQMLNNAIDAAIAQKG